MKRDLLPPYEKLTKDQDRAIRYPDHTSLLVTGPPGSGKTVIALYRSKELLKHNKKVKFLVYGKVLHSYINSSIDKLGLDVGVQTFHTWFPRYIRKTLKRNPPQIKNFEYDFNEIFKICGDDFIKEFDQLIIDEGQDIPRNFYHLATRLSKSITVFADENQSIFEGTNSSIKQIRKTLEKFTPIEIALTKNFRNTRRIAELSSLFKVDGIETGATELPSEIGEYPILYKAPSSDLFLDYVISYHERNPQKTIGIFAYSQSDVSKIFWKLKEKNVQQAQFYVSKRDVRPPNFSKSGIYVVTFASAKGLEFDTVFVPDLHKITDDGTPKLRMSLYVVLTRAREKLIISFQGETPPSLFAEALIINKERKLLEIKSLSQPSERITTTKDIEEKKATVSKASRSENIDFLDLYDGLGEELNETNYLRARKIFQRYEKGRASVFRKELLGIAHKNMVGQMKKDIIEILERL